jgi:hypothetical protein
MFSEHVHIVPICPKSSGIDTSEGTPVRLGGFRLLLVYIRLFLQVIHLGEGTGYLAIQLRTILCRM